MISAVIAAISYLIAGGRVFYLLCIRDREQVEPLRAGAGKCFLLAAAWPVTLMYGLLLIVYSRIVDGK